MTDHLVRIVPGDPESGKTQGTRVVMPSGEDLPSVTKIVLTAECNGLWRAEITCRCLAPELAGVVANVSERGNDCIEVTDLQNTSREFEMRYSSIPQPAERLDYFDFRGRALDTIGLSLIGGALAVLAYLLMPLVVQGR